MSKDVSLKSMFREYRIPLLLLLVGLVFSFMVAQELHEAGHLLIVDVDVCYLRFSSFVKE